jgi:DNA-binding response OmpR family regulator
MTANAMDRDREMCLAAGMNDHLAKPIDPDKLFGALLRWIRPRAASAPPQPEFGSIRFLLRRGISPSALADLVIRH